MEARGEGARTDDRGARRARRAPAMRAVLIDAPAPQARRGAGADARRGSIRQRRRSAPQPMRIEPASHCSQPAPSAAQRHLRGAGAAPARRDRGRGAVRRRLARPLRHRRLDLPDHAGRRVRADDRARRRDRASTSRASSKVPVLPRGGGTSQCGQTTGAALVIDNSKHLRQRARRSTSKRAPPRSSRASCSTT